MLMVCMGAGMKSPRRIASRSSCSRCRRAAYAAIASCMMGQRSAVSLVMNMGRFVSMESVYRVSASAALGLRHLAHRHSEAVGVCLGDLQTSGQGVATNPEAEGERTEGEDQAGHGSFRFDGINLQGQGALPAP